MRTAGRLRRLTNQRWRNRPSQDDALVAAGERTRIAREVHDIVAHSLAVVIAQADAARLTVATDPAGAEERIRAVADNGRRALADVREALRVLRAGDDHAAPLAPLPRLDALADLADGAQLAGLAVRLDNLGPRPHTLTEAWQLGIHRVVQEALTNTLKHAGPGARVSVRLEWGDDRLRLTVADSGGNRRQPPDSGRSRHQPADSRESHCRLPARANPGGLGLTGMRERVQAFGGTLTAGPAEGAAGTGWVVRATVPYVSDAALRSPA